MTKSAPSSSGLWRIGVAKVLSTTTIAPASCATFAILLISMIFTVGFVGLQVNQLTSFSYLFFQRLMVIRDRKSTRLNSSHVSISYAVFCLKKKKKNAYIYHYSRV